MSLGFIPVIISLLLCEFVAQEVSIYIGAFAGLLSYFFSWHHKGRYIPPIILNCTTGMLLCLSVATLFMAGGRPLSAFPLVVEISAVIPPLAIYLNRKRFLNYHTARAGRCCRQLFTQAAESAIVSSRVILIIALTHLLAILLAALVSRPLGSTTRYMLFHAAPPAVFILCILFNQFGILYFNRLMRHTTFVPTVNKEGDVIGKVPYAEAIGKKSGEIFPIIRIAVASHGMLYLVPRPPCCTPEAGKTDLPMEGYLLYGETLEQAATRILRQTLPAAPAGALLFNLMHHFGDGHENRLVYLFTLDLDDDSILCNQAFKGGKLWTLNQLERNLGKDYFSRCLEYEYDHLKTIICTREKYKES